MNKHTHTEWLREGNTVYALNLEGSNRFYLQVQGGWATQGRVRTDEAELEANARLIAVAPELLELLQAVVATRGKHFINNDVGGMHEWDDRVLSVIAKATGESE